MSDEAAAPPATPIAVIGLGHMGGPMAANFVAAGFEVRGFDVAPAACADAAAAGVLIAGSVAEAVRDAAVVLTSLPSGSLVLDTYRAADGVLASARAGTLLIDCSTVDVEEARAAAAAATAAGMTALDAPVSGGVGGAVAGTLTFMVGGSAAAFAQAQPYLRVLGAKSVHCGEAGAGQAVKLANNMLLAVHQIAVAEAFALVQQLGVSADAFYDVASAATGACWALNTNCPVPGPVPASPANHDYEPGFAVTLMNKDLALALAAAERTGTDAALGEHARQLFGAVAAAGEGDRDFSVVYRGIAARSGLPSR